MPPLIQLLGKHLPHVTRGQTEDTLLEDEDNALLEDEDEEFDV